MIYPSLWKCCKSHDTEWGLQSYKKGGKIIGNLIVNILQYWAVSLDMFCLHWDKLHR